MGNSSNDADSTYSTKSVCSWKIGADANTAAESVLQLKHFLQTMLSVGSSFRQPGQLFPSPSRPLYPKSSVD
jgi:hypothetical protein